MGHDDQMITFRSIARKTTKWRTPFITVPFRFSALSVSILFFSFVVLYLFDVANFSISIDDELAAFRESADIWAQQGRWTTYLLERFILTQPTIPSFSVLIFGICGTLGYVFILMAHGVRRILNRDYILFPIFIGFPMWFFLVNFYSNIFSVGVGLLTCCVSIFILSSTFRKNRISTIYNGVLILSSAFLSAISIGAYQSFIFLYFCSGIGVIITTHSRRDLTSFTRNFIMLVLSSILSLMIYVLINYVILAVLDRNVAYIGNFNHISVLIREPLTVISKTLASASNIYGGANLIYGHVSLEIPIALLTGALSLLCAYRRAGIAKLVVAGLLFGLALATPFAMNFVSAGFMPYRTFVALPYLLWLCCISNFRSSTAVGRLVAYIVCIALAFSNLYTYSLFNASKSIQLDRDKLFASQIYGSIVKHGILPNGEKYYPLETFGARQFESVYPRVPSSPMGHSFFSWDGGNPYRIAYFMRMMGYNVRPISMKRRASLLPYFKDMPIWPAEGSIKVVDGITLLKLGTDPGTIQKMAVAER